MRKSLFSGKALLLGMSMSMFLSTSAQAVPWNLENWQVNSKISEYQNSKINQSILNGSFNQFSQNFFNTLDEVCFLSDFAGITTGDNTSSTGSNTAWDGDANFPTVVKAYQAGGAVRLGTGSLVGSIESMDLTDISGNVTVNVMVKGWTNVEGDLKISLGGQEQTVAYAAKMADPFELVSVQFTGVAAGSKLKIETTAKRAFIDNVEIMCEGADPVTYCVPGATNAARFINNFSTTGGSVNVSNLATGFSTGGYGDFTATHEVSQVKGQTIDFSADIVGGTAGFRAWVDWNQDGIFDTTNEVAFSSNGYLATQTGTITVPTTALTGETRMRVVSHWLSTTGSVDPCITGFTYGEFEDYTFTVEEMADCTGTPDGGTVAVNPATGNVGSTYTVSASGFTTAGAMTYQWQSNTDAAGWVDQGTATSTYADYTATAPAPIGTVTEWRLAVTCTTSTETAYATSANFTTVLEYCTPSILSGVEAISKVVFADINNSSDPDGSLGYEDFTAVVGNVTAGEVYDIALEGNSEGDYTNYFTVWADWNNNGTFETAEMTEVGSIVNSTGTDGQQATSTITVPADAAIGSVRMRVIKNYNTSPTDPCANYNFGQIEDYTLNIEGDEPLVYCIPEATNVERYTDNFSTTGGAVNISNLASGFSPAGYGDFFATHEVSQVQGQSIDFTADFVGGTFGFRAWVDWNQDGTFDTTEEVAFASNTYLASWSGSITVPITALTGETRMRVVSHWLSTTGDVDPCATGFTYGEFEDYKFTVLAMDDCSGTPEAGTVTVAPTSGNPGSAYVVSASGYTVANGLTFQWQSNTAGAGWVDEGTATSTYADFNATAPSDLGVQVEWRLNVTCTASGETASSTTGTFTTVISYCIPTYSYGVEPITKVIFAGIDNASDPNSSEPFEDFTAVQGSVNQGGTYDVTLEGNTEGPYTNFFTVWVDWNQNGTFETSEMTEIGSISSSTGTDGQQATNTIAVPVDAVIGVARVRVIKNYDESPIDPCGTYMYGQTEDYTVNVAELGVGDVNNAKLAYYPNPVKDVLNISSQKEVKSVSIFNLAGQNVISNAKVNNGKINVSALTAGTYVFKVTFEGGKVEAFKIIKK